MGHKTVKNSEYKEMGKEPGEPLNCPMERNFWSQDREGKPKRRVLEYQSTHVCANPRTEPPERVRRKLHELT